MEHIHQGYRGLTILVGVNWDRLFFVGSIVLALGAGAFLGTLIV